VNKRAPRDLSIVFAAPGLGHWIEPPNRLEYQ
jgi:hypothetical protein